MEETMKEKQQETSNEKYHYSEDGQSPLMCGETGNIKIVNNIFKSNCIECIRKGKRKTC
jgi:hypothetical protein